jgi:RNA polymerase sigma-70 factor (ECF subfamily)
MQEIFAEIFLSLNKYKAERGSFKTWIGRITVYSCIDQLKKKQKLELNYGLEVLKDVSDSSFESMNKLNRDDIENLLDQMPFGYRTIFLLSVIDNYSHKEIGKMLSISPETSRSQLSRAKNWIKRNLFVSSSKMMYEAL